MREARNVVLELILNSCICFLILKMTALNSNMMLLYHFWCKFQNIIPIVHFLF